MKTNLTTSLEIKKDLEYVNTFIASSLMPDPSLVAAEVVKKPFEPFGVPGVNSFRLDREKDAEKASAAKPLV